ncbi:hypothetical protein [Magnetospirillum sp. 15-1]|uniref:hypothetical protein n=1 Tax=Magnetospirillum sp. 15-1 TaxID=1979370 RepID=UPI0011431BD0|nr:hypothetical protein [Magnetospirillum sp. 15-1]
MTYIWTPELRELFDALRRYKRAMERYSRATPSIDEAKAELNSAISGVQEIILKKHIADMLEDATEHTGDTDASKTGHQFAKRRPTELIKDDIFSFELSLMNNFGYSKSSARRLLKRAAILDTLISGHEIGDAATNFAETANNAIEQVDEARGMPRKIRKPRKRDILRGTLSLGLGIGVVAANTQFPPTMGFSYAVGCVAAHQGIRDLVGEKD